MACSRVFDRLWSRRRAGTVGSAHVEATCLTQPCGRTAALSPERLGPQEALNAPGARALGFAYYEGCAEIADRLSNRWHGEDARSSAVIKLRESLVQ